MPNIENRKNSDYYTNLVSIRNVIYNDITKALEVVREFIIRKNLILTGGMAIDMALRLKGDSIYTDDQIPDYDFYSTNHTADAYELSSILCKKGFDNISCINAMHLTTMRVRVDFETVADITYCPVSVYRKIPTLNFNGLRIVHPHWQMSDQHSALSLPFTNPGREVIFHRWKKDMERYDKLYKHYPVVPVLESIERSTDNIETTLKNVQSKKYTIEGGRYILQRTVERERLAKTLEIPMRTVRIPLEKLSGSCISGWGAIDYKLDGDYITLLIPVGEHISVSSYCYSDFIKHHGLDVLEYYSEYFGKLPRSIICLSNFTDNKGLNKKIEVFDIFGMLISAKLVDKKNDVWVCNIQWAMVYLLVRIFSSDDPKIVFTAEEQYIRCRQLVMDGVYPTIDVYGKYNFTHSYLNSKKLDKEKIYSIKAPPLQPPKFFPKLPNCVNDKKFDPETSEYFMVDARKMDKVIEWTLDPYPEYTQESLR